MLAKKDDQLVDLEAMIPKEHKQGALTECEGTATDSTAGSPSTQPAELCYSCSRSSDEVALLPVFHQGVDKWVCPKCLKSHIDSDAGSSYFGGCGSSGSPAMDSTGSSPDSQDEEYRSPMSMFD